MSEGGVNGIKNARTRTPTPPIYLNNQNMKSKKGTSNFANLNHLFIFCAYIWKTNNPQHQNAGKSNQAFLVSASHLLLINQPSSFRWLSPWCPGTAHRRWALVLLAPNHVPGTVWFGPPRSVGVGNHRNKCISRKCFCQFTRKDLVLHNIWGVTFSFSETLSWGATLSKQVGASYVWKFVFHTKKRPIDRESQTSH